MVLGEETFHAHLGSTLAILKCSGSFLVNFKHEKYSALGRFYLFLPLVIISICNLHYINLIVELIASGTSIKTANGFVVILVRLFNQIEIFHCCIFVILKSKKVADLLNAFLQIEQQLNVNYHNRKFISLLFLYGCVVIGTVIYSYFKRSFTLIILFTYIIIELFILSLIAQVLFFVYLTKMVNQQLNNDLETKKRLNLGFVVNLRNVREQLSDLYEKIQDVFGFAILIVVFNRALFLIQDVNVLVGQCLSFAYKETKFAEMLSDVFIGVIWCFLDSFLMIVAVIVCSKAEFEVNS